MLEQFLFYSIKSKYLSFLRNYPKVYVSKQNLYAFKFILFTYYNGATSDTNLAVGGIHKLKKYQTICW